MSLPLLAAGGIADPASARAALAAGASAVVMGTRFVASDECGPYMDLTRIVTMVQMITGFIVVGLLGKIVFAAMQKGLRRQDDERATETDDRAGGSGERDPPHPLTQVVSTPRRLTPGG